MFICQRPRVSYPLSVDSIVKGNMAKVVLWYLKRRLKGDKWSVKKLYGCCTVVIYYMLFYLEMFTGVISTFCKYVWKGLSLGILHNVDLTFRQYDVSFSYRFDWNLLIYNYSVVYSN